MPARHLTAAAVVVAVALVACGADEPRVSTPTAPAPTSAPAATTTGSQPSTSPTTEAPRADVTIVVTYQGGQVTTDSKRVRVKRGQTVALTVTTDVAEELHIHGEDITKELPANTSVTVTFEAKQTGAFEVELERSHVELLQLQVSS